MPSPAESYQQVLRMQQQQQQQPNSWAGSGTYLSSGNIDPNQGMGSWEDLIRQLGFSNIENITDFQSPLYQEYAKYLQKTMPGIGVNSLLAPLMAGGVGYAGGQNIANQKLQGMNRERQDKINTGVQGFASSMQSQVMPQLGQIGNSFQNTMQRVSQEDMFNQQNSGWGLVGQTVGGLAGMFNPMSLFGGGGASGYGGYNSGGATAQKPVAGY
jgi:hypothetical protein